MWDIAVIGAGISGLVCARRLQQAGHRVVVLDKSRGVGGRVATRRLHNTIADHGARYLGHRSTDSPDFVNFIHQLRSLDIFAALASSLSSTAPRG